MITVIKLRRGTAIVSNKRQYRTKQRQMILSYLEQNPNTHLTAGDVCGHLCGCGADVGQATVYRQLERFVDEGLVNKYLIDANSPACFEFIGENTSASEDVCFHCKCERCGRLIHMRCEELEGIGKHMFEEHRFKIDPLRTVFYGICEDCLKEEA